MGIGINLPRRFAGILLVVASVMYGPALAAAEFGFSGMHVQGVNQAIATALGLKKAEGVMVMDVALGGPADFAGVKRGDRIIRFNKAHIDTFKRLVKIVTSTRPGQTVEFDIDRRGRKRSLKMKLGSKPASWKVAKGSVINFSAIGVTMAAITPKIRQRFNIRWGSVGVLVTLIDPAFAERMLLKRGDVIVQINQRDVWRPDQIKRAYDSAKEAKTEKLLMLIERPDGFRYMMLPVK